MNTNETMYHGIKQASKAMKLSIDFLRRARAHPDCPNSTEGGFAKSGRIYATKDFLNWLEEHKEELNTVTPETIEWWDTLRIKYQTLALELELEERRKKVVNKKDAIDTMQRMRQAYNQLMQSKLKGELVERIQLKPEDTIHLDSFIQEMDQVWIKGIESLR